MVGKVDTHPSEVISSALDPGSTFSRMAFRFPLRHYQQVAVDAFEEVRARSRRTAYLVWPPGAGKTVLRLEIARRLANRTLVLCPNTAVVRLVAQADGYYQGAR